MSADNHSSGPVRTTAGDSWTTPSTVGALELRKLQIDPHDCTSGLTCCSRAVAPAAALAAAGMPTPAPSVQACREDFPGFPFQPYAIQQDFMRELYLALCKGSIGLFESPTGEPYRLGLDRPPPARSPLPRLTGLSGRAGTGKSLSLLSTVLQWVKDQAAATTSPDAGPAPVCCLAPLRQTVEYCFSLVCQCRLLPISTAGAAVLDHRPASTSSAKGHTRQGRQQRQAASECRCSR